MAERPESSVSPDFDAWGDICFPGVDHGKVIHRTPEELGIPRVVRDAPPFARATPVSAGVAELPEALRAAQWPAAATLDAMERRLGLKVSDAPKIGARKVRRAARARRPADSLEGVTTRVVLGSNGRGVEVRMSAHAVMGAELIDGLAATIEAVPADEREKVEEMPRGKFDRPTSELKTKVLAEPDAEVADLVTRLGATKSQVYQWRYAARKKAEVLPGKKKGGRLKKAHQPPPAGAASPPPGDHALTAALARHDARAARTVRIELTDGEVAALLGKLNDEQRGAFLAAGLKAALLVS